MSFRTGLVGEASRTDGRCGAGSALALYRCVFSPVQTSVQTCVQTSVEADNRRNGVQR
jgi:hypothetical protein